MARTLLHIDSSAKGAASDSATLSQAFVQRWQDAHPGDNIRTRDIVSHPLPHLDETLIGAMTTPADQHSPAFSTAFRRADELVDEFLAADVLVIGAPMYNFGIPSTLKAWVDHIVQPERTFRYTEKGPVGLAGGKQVFIISTRGGIYDNSPMDHQAQYLKHLFGLLAIEDVSVIQAEGLDISPESRERSLAAAHQTIEQIVSSQAEAA